MLQTSALVVRRMIMTVTFAITVVLLLSFVSWYFMIRMPGESFTGSPEPLDAAGEAAMFDLRRDVEQLSWGIGARNVDNFEGLERARNYVAGQFEMAGLTPEFQEYSAAGRLVANVAAVLPGTERRDEIIVIGAHYDSISGSPAADDNASGVAVLLSLARRLRGGSWPRTLHLVAFVNEEEPFFGTDLQGSVQYASQLHRAGAKVKGMLSLEMLGYYSQAADSQRYPFPLSFFYPSTGNFVAFVGDVRSGLLVRQAVGAFRRVAQVPSEGAAVPAWLKGVSLSDHASFWEQGYPALMVTDTSFFRYPYYHSAEDTLDRLDYYTMARVADGLYHVAADLLQPGLDVQEIGKLLGQASR